MATKQRITYRPDGTILETATVDVPDEQVNADLLRQRLTAYLALPSPTAAQREKALRALVKLTLAILADVSDTA